MSNNIESSVGKINYRAITGADAKEIIIGEITKSVRNNPAIKRFLTFHNFHMRWGYKITALADTPVPPEVDMFLNAAAPAFSNEELQQLMNNIELLKAKRQSFQPFLDLVQKIDEYLASRVVEIVDKGEVKDNKRPDVLRQEHNIPVLQTRQVGNRIVEVPIQQPIPQPQNASFDLNVSLPDYKPAEELANSYSADGGGTPKTEMQQKDEGINLDV